MYYNQPLRLLRQQAEKRAMERKSEDEVDMMQFVHQRELDVLMETQARERSCLQSYLAAMEAREQPQVPWLPLAAETHNSMSPRASLDASRILRPSQANEHLRCMETLRKQLRPVRFFSAACTLTPPLPAISHASKSS